MTRPCRWVTELAFGACHIPTYLSICAMVQFVLPVGCCEISISAVSCYFVASICYLRLFVLHCLLLLLLRLLASRTFLAFYCTVWCHSGCSSSCWYNLLSLIHFVFMDCSPVISLAPRQWCCVPPLSHHYDVVLPASSSNFNGRKRSTRLNSF